MRDDDKTEVASRQSPSTTTSVRLFNGLGGVELGVRHTGQKAMLFVRIRKLVIAGWWKAPGVAGKTPIDLAVERADDRRAAAGVASARPSGNSEVASVTTSASVSHAVGVAEIGGSGGSGGSGVGSAGAGDATPKRDRPRIPGRIVRAEPVAPTRVMEPEKTSAEAEVIQPKAQVIDVDATAELAEDPNVMHRLWRRVTSPFKKDR